MGVYTSGKGSSAAGLTASVIRDSKREYYLEVCQPPPPLVSPTINPCLFVPWPMQTAPFVTVARRLLELAGWLERSDPTQSLNSTLAQPSHNPTPTLDTRRMF